MKQRDFLLWLLLVPGVGIVGRTRVWEYMVVHGLNELSLQEVHQLAGVPQQQRASSRVFCQSDVATRQFEKLKTTHYVTIADEEYPTWLAEIDCPPVVLFYQGNFLFARYPSRLSAPVKCHRMGNKLLKALCQLLWTLALLRYLG